MSTASPSGPSSTLEKLLEQARSLHVNVAVPALVPALERPLERLVPDPPRLELAVAGLFGRDWVRAYAFQAAVQHDADGWGDLPVSEGRNNLLVEKAVYGEERTLLAAWATYRGGILRFRPSAGISQEFAEIVFEEGRLKTTEAGILNFLCYVCIVHAEVFRKHRERQARLRAEAAEKEKAEKEKTAAARGEQAAAALGEVSSGDTTDTDVYELLPPPTVMLQGQGDSSSGPKPTVLASAAGPSEIKPFQTGPHHDDDDDDEDEDELSARTATGPGTRKIEKKKVKYTYKGKGKGKAGRRR